MSQGSRSLSFYTQDILTNLCWRWVHVMDEWGVHGDLSAKSVNLNHATFVRLAPVWKAKRGKETREIYSCVGCCTEYLFSLYKWNLYYKTIHNLLQWKWSYVTWSREMSHLSKISISIFLHHFLITSKCFILMHTPLQLDIWLQSYEGFDNYKNNIKQRNLNTVFANISITTFPTSDSFLLIMSHMWHDQGKRVTCRKKNTISVFVHHHCLTILQNGSFWCKPHYNWISGYRVM